MAPVVSRPASKPPVRGGDGQAVLNSAAYGRLAPEDKKALQESASEAELKEKLGNKPAVLQAAMEAAMCRTKLYTLVLPQLFALLFKP